MLFNDSKYMYDVLNDSLSNLQISSKDNVSEFTHSNWIMLSYYSSPKHKESAS